VADKYRGRKHVKTYSEADLLALAKKAREKELKQRGSGVATLEAQAAEEEASESGEGDEDDEQDEEADEEGQEAEEQEKSKAEAKRGELLMLTDMEATPRQQQSALAKKASFVLSDSSKEVGPNTPQAIDKVRARRSPSGTPPAAGGAVVKQEIEYEEGDEASRRKAPSHWLQVLDPVAVLNKVSYEKNMRWAKQCCAWCGRRETWRRPGVEKTQQL
jgi:hypothetical protein